MIDDDAYADNDDIHYNDDDGYDCHQQETVVQSQPGQPRLEEELPPRSPEIKAMKNMKCRLDIVECRLCKQWETGISYKDDGRGSVSHKVIWIMVDIYMIL